MRNDFPNCPKRYATPSKVNVSISVTVNTPWVRARQEQAEADVRGAWAQDPVALLETKGTPEVHGKGAVVN